VSRLEAVSELDPRLVAIAEQAQRVGWVVEWHDGTWLRICAAQGRVTVSVFAHATYGLQCIPGVNGLDSGGPLEALRAAYAALGVALDQAEESGLGRLETPAQDSDA
jgi:hypothetical protein